MKLSTFWKGLFMALVGFIATTLSDLETFNIAYVAVSTIAFTVIYVGKNYLFPSISVVGIDLQDFISGLVLAVGMGFSSFAGQILVTGVLDWSALWVAVVGAFVGYFVKTVPSKAIK